MPNPKYTNNTLISRQILKDTIPQVSNLKGDRSKRIGIFDWL